MNRKNNPWISLIALLLLTTILIYVCSGCERKEAHGLPKAETEARFMIEHHIMIEKESGIIRYADIITDKKTGEQYLFYKSGSGSGLTNMEG